MGWEIDSQSEKLRQGTIFNLHAYAFTNGILMRIRRVRPLQFNCGIVSLYGIHAKNNIRDIFCGHCQAGDS